MDNLKRIFFIAEIQKNRTRNSVKNHLKTTIRKNTNNIKLLKPIPKKKYEKLQEMWLKLKRK